MKYLCLIYNEKHGAGDVSEDERQALARESRTYGEELRRKHHLVAARALRRGETATTVRVRNGRLSITEEPPLPSGDRDAGERFRLSRDERPRAFVLVEARDLNEAIQVASRMPEARVGSIEVWPGDCSADE